MYLSIYKYICIDLSTHRFANGLSYLAFTTSSGVMVGMTMLVRVMSNGTVEAARMEPDESESLSLAPNRSPAQSAMSVEKYWTVMTAPQMII